MTVIKDYHHEKGLPDFFLAGCQKTASTWLYQCFAEHPEIHVPATDATHFFTFNYHKGLDWYKQIYKDYRNQQIVGDTTPSYIRDFDAPERIAAYYPEAKIIFTLRNPIDRAFSHYWHEKAKNKINYDFSEVLDNYDLYQNYIVSGFYYKYLCRYLNYFKREQILILVFDELKQDPESFIRKIYQFLNVDTNHRPSILTEKINPAAKRKIRKKSYLGNLLHSVHVDINKPGNKSMFAKLCRLLLRVKKQILQFFTVKNESEYIKGMNPTLKKELIEIYREENIRLGELLDMNFSMWNKE